MQEQDYQIKEEGFFTKWKKGIQEITPEQSSKINFVGIAFVFIGIFIGLAVTWKNEVYWLFLVLVGSLFLSTVNLIGMLQRYFQIIDFNKKLQEVKNE